MKAFMKTLKRQDGFTLVELMVVVAIIGLLSAVAIPNFKKYQAKAKMSEAKLQLSAIYTAESSFFSDYTLYASCLRYMGFDPSLERNSRYYAVGFPLTGTTRNATTHTSALNSGLLDASCPAASTAVDGTSNTTDTATYFLAAKTVGSATVNTLALMTANAAATAGDCTDATAVTGGTCLGDQAGTGTMSFNAAAVGFISADKITGALASGLTIDNNKIIRTHVSGF
jgi:type IV pilus assembly protein PilA